MTDFSIIFADEKREFFHDYLECYFAWVYVQKNIHLRIRTVNLGLGENSENISIPCQQNFPND